MDLEEKLQKVLAIMRAAHDCEVRVALEPGVEQYTARALFVRDAVERTFFRGIGSTVDDAVHDLHAKAEKWRGAIVALTPPEAA